MARLVSCALLLALTALAGCESGPRKATAKGTVTLDGKKLEDGTIQFFDVDQKAPSAATAIKDGDYVADVYVGRMQVQIFAPKVVGTRKLYDTPDSPVKDVTKEMIPERYNLKSELTTEFKAGENTADFELKTGK